MKLSPQSEAVVQELRAGVSVQSSSITIGPLDLLTQSLLDVLIESFEDISGKTGEDQARAVRNHVVKQIAIIRARQQPTPVSQSGEGLPSDQHAQRPPPIAVSIGEPPKWKLMAFRCESIRGVAPPGELFSFEFHGESNLIYGPNGSGKSSLLTAVLWCLTGEIIADSELEDEESPMYRVTGSGSKARSWPHVVTLPEPTGFEAASPACWVELRLQRAVDGKNLWFRRTYPAVFEASWDGDAWSPCNDLSEFCITPLDLQLSLIAPTTFSRRSLEEARNVRGILTLMLGFDNLEELGDLASKISGNRTRLQNFEEATLRRKMEEIRALLNQLADALPESNAEKQTILALATTGAPSRKDFEEAQKAVDKALSAAEQALAQDLGLTEAKGNALAGLADKVTVGLAKLEKGVAICFPSLAALQLASVLPPAEDASSEQLLQGIRSAVVEYRDGASQAIARRADWWRRERAPGSKVSLLLKAAQYYDPNQKVCPVCDRCIDDTKLNAELTSLRTLDPQLSKELQMFFADLTKGLNKTVSQSVLSLVEVTPTKRLLADWSSICDELGPAFTTLTQSYEKKVTEIASAITLKQLPEPDLLPTEIDDVFRTEAAEFLKVVANAEQALGLLEWAVENLVPILNDLDNLITTQSDKSPRTLYVALAQGKRAAAVVKPLALAKSGLTSATRASSDIETLRLGVERLKKLADPLDKLKLLSKYAENEVRTVFDSIRDATVENAKHLYPESATGMKLGHLKMGKGKDRSIEAMLSTRTYQVPGQFFANAGLQRAVALSFYFALLKRHPCGLGFLVMDDPILSLDEDHRERWSSKILRPILATIQVVLSTHQSQYLNNCGADFSADRIVRLNPRSREQRISWQPGDRLRRAERMLDTHHHEAAQGMRKFREDILISFDAYSTTPFFNQHNLADSLRDYAKLVPPHPLVSKARDKIVDVLQKQEVTRVLDPAMHALTEADVTRPMVEDCLRELSLLEPQVNKELERLARLRKHHLRGSRIPSAVLPFSRLNARVTWCDRLSVSLIGTAAARSSPWIVDMGDDGQVLTLAPGAAVLVANDTLDPVARCGQWVLLATEDIVANDGDLAAVMDADGNRYLRRVWSDGENWTLEGVNPVHPQPTVSVQKIGAPLRKIIGVLYEPTAKASHKSGKIAEWEPSATIDVQAAIRKYLAIDVMGASIEPLARAGQKVLVGEKCDDLSNISSATLAVVQTGDESVGNVIKRVYPTPGNWILVSPNPVEPIDPILLPRKEIKGIWPVCGVLFETSDESP